MNEIGQKLREAREAKGLTLKEVSVKTRIRSLYLKAIEEGDFERIPGSVYAKGFIKSFANAVDLDPTELVQEYQESLKPDPEEEENLAETSVASRQSSKVLRTIVITLVVVVIVGGIFFGVKTVWQTIQTETIPHLTEKDEESELRTDQTENDKDTATEVEQDEVDNSEIDNSEIDNSEIDNSPKEDTSKSQSTSSKDEGSLSTEKRTEPEPDSEKEVQKTQVGKNELKITATQKAWVRLSADGETIYQGVLEKGETRIFKGDKLQLRTYNAGAILFNLNGVKKGQLGQEGQYIEKVIGE